MKVSLIITSYNYGPYIERAIRSCLSQSVSQKDYEVIIVDDASTDDTLEIIGKYTQLPNVRIIANEHNVGVAESSNIGIRQSFGQFVVRVDADDYVNSNFVLFLSSYLEANNDVLGVACDYIKIDNDEKVLDRFSAQTDPISCGIMYRKDLLVTAGLYNTDFRHAEEAELRRRLGDRYQIEYLKIPLYRYRMHGSNKTTNVAEVAEYQARIGTMYDR